MKKYLLVWVVVGLGSAFAQSPSPFVDVSPCHWATDAVRSIAGEPQVSERQALGSNYLAENSLRQVFEGLKCGDLAWSAYFMDGVPAGTAPQGTLQNFALSGVSSSLSGNSGTVAFTVTATVDGQTYTKTGTAALTYAGDHWQVSYPDLATLDLPVLP